MRRHPCFIGGTAASLRLTVERPGVKGVSDIRQNTFSDDLMTLDVRPHRTKTTARWRESVQRVLVHMRDHIEEKQSSEEFAGVGAISRFHFNRVFRRTTGIPPAHFLGAMRFEMAKRLLLTTEMSVTDICFEVGYNSLGTFVSRFTQLVGISPSELRRVARILEGTDLRSLCNAVSSGRKRPLATSIVGQIKIGSEFCGVLFVGLYETLLPHARPLQCQCLSAPGSFSFGPVRDGTYTVAAAGVHYLVDPRTFLNEGAVVRGASKPVVVAASRGERNLEVSLRPTTPFDPPILAPLPAMLLSAQPGVDSINRL